MKVHIPIYIINLKRNPERRLHIQRQLDAFGLKYQFVDAIDKYDLESAEYRSRLAQSLGMDESNLEYKHTETVRTSQANKEYNNEGLGRVACLLSHIKACNLILQNNDDSACILEDDALLLPTFAKVLAASSKLTWDILTFSSQSKTVHKALENSFYKRIMKSHNHIVLIKGSSKVNNMHNRITKLLSFSPHTYPNQSNSVMKILEGFSSRYKDMIELYNPSKSLIWVLSPSTLEAIRHYKVLKEYTACRLGGLPVKHSHQSINEHHCIAEPGEPHSSAMAYLLKRSAIEKWKQTAIGRNILGADDIPWHLYTYNRICLRFVSPPCVVAPYTYLRYSSHYR